MNSRGIAISSLFGTIIFVQKAALPAPYDKLITVLIQMSLLSLAYMISGFNGPILTGCISGLLTASARGGLAAMTFSLAMLYGVLVSILHRLFGVIEEGHIRRWRLMASSLASSLIVGLIGMVVSTVLGLIPYEPFLFVLMLAAGAVQGAVGGLLSGYVWERHFRHISPF